MCRCLGCSTSTSDRLNLALRVYWVALTPMTVVYNVQITTSLSSDEPHRYMTTWKAHISDETMSKAYSYTFIISNVVPRSLLDVCNSWFYASYSRPVVLVHRLVGALGNQPVADGQQTDNLVVFSTNVPQHLCRFALPIRKHCDSWKSCSWWVRSGIRGMEFQCYFRTCPRS